MKPFVGPYIAVSPCFAYCSLHVATPKASTKLHQPCIGPWQLAAHWQAHWRLVDELVTTKTLVTWAKWTSTETGHRTIFFQSIQVGKRVSVHPKQSGTCWSSERDLQLFPTWAPESLAKSKKKQNLGFATTAIHFRPNSCHTFLHWRAWKLDHTTGSNANHLWSKKVLAREEQTSGFLNGDEQDLWNITCGLKAYRSTREYQGYMIFRATVLHRSMILASWHGHFHHAGAMRMQQLTHDQGADRPSHPARHVELWMLWRSMAVMNGSAALPLCKTPCFCHMIRQSIARHGKARCQSNSLQHWKGFLLIQLSDQGQANPKRLTHLQSRYGSWSLVTSQITSTVTLDGTLSHAAWTMVIPCGSLWTPV